MSSTDALSRTTKYTYDLFGNVLTRSVTLTAGTILTWTYTYNFRFSYDVLSRRTQMTRPNGVNTDYSYDSLSRLLSVLHKLSGTTVDGASYTVDSVGNRTAKTNQLNAAADAYSYDSIYQLTQVVQTPSGSGPSTTESYGYDQVGNRTSSLAALPWSYNSSNHLTSIAGTPGTTFTYDNNGNTLTKVDAAGTTTYAWDYENRLTSVTLPSTAVVSFKYDPLGRRIQKATASATTVYAYDGENIIEETDTTGAAQARFAMGLAIDEPLAQLRSSVTHFYSADGLGSVTSLTDGVGAVVANYTYDAFGNATATTGSVSNPFRYTAREWDSEIGLYFYRARYYHPAAGRFLSGDPIGFAGGINFYSYVHNRATNATDPTGEYIVVKGDALAWSKALLHLAKDPAARGIIQALAKSALTVTIIVDPSLSCDPGQGGGGEHSSILGEIRWNPHCALRCEDGRLQSPALGLYHELVHEARLQQASGLYPKNKEEDFVVRYFETPTARALGQGVRSSHAEGVPVLVKTPVSH